jgi:hypothetical protein
MPRPCFTPTDAQRRLVTAGVAVGLDQATIAAGIGITKPTLEKHFQTELIQANAATKLQVAATLLKMAASGTCPAATIFWAKTRLKMSERPDLGFTGLLFAQNDLD